MRQPQCDAVMACPRGVVRSLWYLILAYMLAAPFGSAQAADTRVALVIGDSTYISVGSLANATNDARLMARTLSTVGFKIVGGGAQLDLDKAGFDNAIQQFGAEITGSDVALFYCAGHGVQVRGNNYLVPVSANPARETDVDFQMEDVQLVIRQMAASGTILNLLILDACRNNPFGGRGLRATGGGLTQMQAPEGTLISYATQPGNVASDGTDGDRPFTKALAEAIQKPDSGVFDVFNHVGVAVETPSTSSSSTKTDAELLFWQTIVNSRDPDDFADYLKQYPKGTISSLASRKIVTLTSPGPMYPATVGSASARPTAAPSSPAARISQDQPTKAQVDRPGLQQLDAQQAASAEARRRQQASDEERVIQDKKNHIECNVSSNSNINSIGNTQASVTYFIDVVGPQEIRIRTFMLPDQKLLSDGILSEGGFFPNEPNIPIHVSVSETAIEFSYAGNFVTQNGNFSSSNSVIDRQKGTYRMHAEARNKNSDSPFSAVTDGNGTCQDGRTN